MKNVIVLNESNFNEFIGEKGKRIIVDFYASWCGPCRMLAPILDDIAGFVGEKYKFGKLDIDESFSIAKNYSVMSVPTLIVFEDGVEVKRIVGLKNKDALLKDIM